jgi:phage gp45-like
MRSVKQLREQTKPAVVHAAGAIRRMAIALTSKALWQLTGLRLLDNSTEVMTAEPFGGIGFHARPAASGKPEAIVLLVGDNATTPVVVAVRDEKTRQAIAGALAGDETAMFNSQAIVVCKADGTVEVRSKNGTAKKLITFDEFMRHTHATAATGAPVTPTAISGDPLAGTDVIKGE